MGDIAHVSLNVSDLDRAVAFYRALFGVEPAIHHQDYARFELEDPPLMLSLEPIYRRAGDSINHLGVRLPTAEAVHAAEARLRALGIVTDPESDVECGYSRQTKLWLLDPDRNLWEVYALTAELPHRGALASSDAVAARDRVGVASAWEHKLGDPIALPLPVYTGGVGQVRLRGTFNQPLSPSLRLELLAEVRRILAPGGELMVHALAADRTVEGPFPRLPGRAALVTHAPIVDEPMAWLREAGFVGLTLERLGERHSFEHDGVCMRELVLVGWAPPAGEATDETATAVVYKGPFPRVVDDHGHEYLAGERIAVDAFTAARLRRGALGDQFVFIGS